MTVALRRGKNEKVPVETLRVAEETFEEQLSRAIAVAEDRAALLNATMEAV